MDPNEAHNWLLHSFNTKESILTNVFLSTLWSILKPD